MSFCVILLILDMSPFCIILLLLVWAMFGILGLCTIDGKLFVIVCGTCLFKFNNDTALLLFENIFPPAWLTNCTGELVLRTMLACVWITWLEGISAGRVFAIPLVIIIFFPAKLFGTDWFSAKPPLGLSFKPPAPRKLAKLIAGESGLIKRGGLW